MSDEDHTTYIGQADLITAAVHEIKSPLTLIASIASMIRDGDFDAVAEQKEQLNRIVLSSDRLLRIVDSVLGMSRLERGRSQLHAEPLIPRQIVSEVATDLKNFAEAKSQLIRCIVSGRLKPVLVDRHALYHVLYNLLDNAIKYSPVGSTIEIRVKKSPHQLAFWVLSEGATVTKADFDRLKRQFNQIDQPITAHPDSNGIGLFVADQLAKLMSGSIGVRKRQSGNCFFVAVPLSGQLSLF